MPLVNCPNCGKQIEWSESEYRPFCSQKCKLLDLGEWIEEGYRVPDESSSPSEEDFRQIEAALEASQNDEHS
ncbi:MAG TPA: DNA gyrase inhibitor YacG [Pyrinomonadaceae bacterium]|jgi:endogenous inhibitor of DNA gyrase (YacG/DUF329 family)|nr:DNA gyrase inhibitor YacG [Pyrinomonadaceae bacterium]